jgi:hypothetical protein
MLPISLGIVPLKLLLSRYRIRNPAGVGTERKIVNQSKHQNIAYLENQNTE